MRAKLTGAIVAAAALPAAMLAVGAMQPAAQAEPQPAGMTCAPHKSLAGFLDQNFDEKREAIGITGSGQLLEIYTSRNGSWTIVLSTPQGTSCIVGAGESWEGGLANLGPRA